MFAFKRRTGVEHPPADVSLCGVLTNFAASVAIGMALGFLFGVGCAAAVLYTIFLSGYRAALRDAAAGGTSRRYREQQARMPQR